MKTIELKTVPMILHGAESDFSYAEFIRILMQTPEKPNEGATIEEVRKSIRVLDALEEAGEVLEIEDADFAYLLHRVNSARFTASNIVFVNFVDYICGIEKE